MFKNDGNLFYIGDFDDEAEDQLIVPLTREIQRQSRYRNGHIDLYINSFGGYRHLVFHLISLIKLAQREDIVVRTIVPDIAYSAGSILAVTGTPGERYIERTGEHLIHYGYTGSAESTPEQVERTYAQKKLGFTKILRHYQAHTEMDAADLDKLMNDDQGYISAARCLKWGLADKYMEKFDIRQSEA